MALWGCVVTSGSGKFLNSFHIEDTTFVSECIVDFSSQLYLAGIQNVRHLSNKMLSVHIILKHYVISNTAVTKQDFLQILIF